MTVDVVYLAGLLPALLTVRWLLLRDNASLSLRRAAGEDVDVMPAAVVGLMSLFAAVLWPFGAAITLAWGTLHLLGRQWR